MKCTQTEETQEKEQSIGVSPLAWRLFTLIWLLFLFEGGLNLEQEHIAGARLLLALFVLLCFIVLYTWLLWPHPLSFQARARKGRRFFWLPFALLVVLTLFLNLVYGASWLWFFIFSSVAAGAVFSTYKAVLIVPGLTLLTAGLGILLIGVDWQQFAIPVLLVGGIGFGITGAIRLFATIRELQLARSELASMAVMDERLRLARDMHDLLGQKLSMITLKSELAGRLITSAPEQAAQEIHVIEQVARQTLHEVREAVAGYRQPQLESELDAACQMLEAAGIICSMTQNVGVLPAATDAVLAWSLREGVTNVIRHSRARQCQISLLREQDTVLAEVVNDGYQKRESGQHKSGTGLTGISERVALLGGRFEAGPLPATGSQSFRLWIELSLLADVGIRKEL